MKRVAVIAALAMLSSAPILGQTPAGKPAAPAPVAKPADKPVVAAPAAKPAGKAAAVAPDAKPAQQATVKVASGTKGGRSRANEDARDCLQLATNTEIIKCAEKYR